jgi:sugar lactone lactonase YvrE
VNQPTSDVRVVRDSGRSILGEGPLWSERHDAVFWVDILGHRLHRLSIADDVVTRWDMPEAIGWIIERETGFIAGMASGFHALTLDPFTVTPIHDPEPDRPDNRMNDAKADAAGRIWAGTMPFSCQGATGALYRLDTDLTCTRVDAPYTIANGPAIAPDGRTLFHTDTALRTIFRFAVHDDGTLGPRTPHIVFARGWGNPDGMTLDADGHLWVAHWGASRITRFDPAGAAERSITLPASQITSMTFAGPDLDRMFVTSAADGVDEEHGGALFEVDPGCRGLPTLRFGG